jgi:hypothetical protein
MDPISMIILSAFISAVITWSVETSANAASQWQRELWAKRKRDCPRGTGGANRNPNPPEQNKENG